MNSFLLRLQLNRYKNLWQMSNKSSLNEKKILLTGGSGFIGKFLVNALLSRSYELTVLTKTPISRCKNISCDFLEEKLQDHFFDDINTIIHLAGYAHNTSSKEDINLHKKLNFELTRNLAIKAQQQGIKKFIFISSVKAEYTSEDEIAFTYDKAKKAAEDYLLLNSINSGMKVIILRPSLVYGPQVKGNLKKMYDAIEKGWLPPVPKINNKRSLVHVDDVVDSILFLMQKEELDETIFTITDGRDYSTREIYDTFCTLLGRKTPSWGVPYPFLKILRKLSPKLNKNIDKLLSDDRYSSRKINRLGFMPKRNLSEMNESYYSQEKN